MSRGARAMGLTQRIPGGMVRAFLTWYCRTRGRSHRHGYGACMRQEEEEEEEGNERARSRGRGGASGAPWLVMRELTLEREHRGWPKRRAKVMMCQDDDRPRCKDGNRDSTLSTANSHLAGVLNGNGRGCNGRSRWPSQGRRRNCTCMRGPMS